MKFCAKRIFLQKQNFTFGKLISGYYLKAVGNHLQRNYLELPLDPCLLLLMGGGGCVVTGTIVVVISELLALALMLVGIGTRRPG